MTDPIDALLETWHAWQSDYAPKLGYAAYDSTCRDYRSSSRQWMSHWDIAEEVDQAELNARCEQIDLCVDRLAWPLRAAIHAKMRNIEAGADLWRSKATYSDAKEALIPMLVEKGLINEYAKSACVA